MTQLSSVSNSPVNALRFGLLWRSPFVRRVFGSSQIVIRSTSSSVSATRPPVFAVGVLAEAGDCGAEGGAALTSACGGSPTFSVVLIVGWSLFMALIIYLVIASSDPEHP